MIIKTNLPYYLNHLLEHVMYREAGLYWTNPSRVVYSIYPDYIVLGIEKSDEASFLKHVRQLHKTHLRELILHEANIISAELSSIYQEDPARWAYSLAVYGESIKSVKEPKKWLESIYLQSISPTSLEQITESLVKIKKVEHLSRDRDEVVDQTTSNLKLVKRPNYDLHSQSFENKSLIDLFRNRYSFLSLIYARYGTVDPGHRTLFYDLFPESTKTVLTIFWQKGIKPLEKVNDSKISPNALQNEINKFRNLIFGDHELDEADYKRKGQFYFGQELSKSELVEIISLFNLINPT